MARAGTFDYICIAENIQVPWLLIGNQELEGKLVQLPKSLALFRKVRHPGADRVREFEMLGVVKQKYLFKNRPKSILKHNVN